MVIKNIKLMNFRNYENQSLEFNNNLNIIYGLNAQGKTNILEAIYMTSCGSSHRTNKDKYILMNGKESYSIELEYENDNEIRDTIKLQYKNREKKIFYFNNIKKKRIADLIGKLNVIFFSPEDLNIIKGSPSLRRREIDITLSQIRPSYFNDLQRYYKILKQRNNLLKELEQKPRLLDTLDIWTDKIAKENTSIIIKRTKYINLLNNYAEKFHQIISDKKESLEIKYDSFINNIEKKDKNEIYKEIKEKYAKIKDYEIRRGFTKLGIHRDDVVFMLNNKDSKEYCSQGQQRSIVLSYKLAELEIMKKYTDNLPVLLLDDVFSELDKNRKKYLLKMIGKVQTFITCTNRDEIDLENLDQYKLYKVDSGNISGE